MQSVMDRDIDHILVSEEQLKTRVAELGTQISKDYAGKNLLLVSILKGSVVFMADLMRAVSIPCGIDFMVVSSYGGANTSSTGLVKIIKDLDADLSGKDVLIVEDILDTGITLSHLVPMLKMRNPNSVKLCTILSKPSRRKADIEPDYCGFEVPVMSLLSATASTITKNIAICRMSVSSSRKCIPSKARVGVKSSGLAPDFRS